MVREIELEIAEKLEKSRKRVYLIVNLFVFIALVVNLFVSIALVLHSFIVCF